MPDQRFARYRKSSLTAMTAATRSSELVVHGLEDIGPSYADTLQAWWGRFLGRLDEVRGLGYDERFVRIWEYYLATCEALFRMRSLRDLQLVLTRPLNDTLARYR